MRPCDVLIIGAGPTGLVLALWLTKLGVPVRIVDKTAEPGTTSRALAVHARTLELYRQLDLADAVVAKGHTVPAVNLWVGGEREARVSFTEIGGDLTPYPFLHIFPQDEHERLLIARLEAMGVTVERQTEYLSHAEEGGRVVARLRGPGGEEERCEVAYIAGCDGASSGVRQTIGVGFPGGTYQQVFYVADVEASGPAIDGELHLALDEADFLAVFPIAGEGRARLIGTVRDARADNAEALTFGDVGRDALQHLKVAVDHVNWFSTYHVHHRVAEHFRIGRAFLLGDSAHIHSPAGGQGMNTGIGDAINLAWKIHAVLGGHAPAALLDSYEEERIAFARRLVKTTDRLFTLVTAEGRMADLIRMRLVPIVLPAVARFEAWREWMFRTVSQITLNYRHGSLSEGRVGEVHGGDRLPWAGAEGLDNDAPLTEMVWQIHCYGEPPAGLAEWCRSRGLPLHLFAWQAEYGEAGLARNAVYVLRPDSYVALADSSGSIDVITRYFDERGIRTALAG